MQTNITNRTIGTIKPQDKPYEVRDTGLKGLLLRVQPSGVMTYYLVFKRGRRIKIGQRAMITLLRKEPLRISRLEGAFVMNFKRYLTTSDVCPTNYKGIGMRVIALPVYQQ